ncbi:MAG: hypothetical protein MUC83_11945 [Pirellula sp.]|nr:hypothetical protein [Pirellula sp.]
MKTVAIPFSCIEFSGSASPAVEPASPTKPARSVPPPVEPVRVPPPVPLPSRNPTVVPGETQPLHTPQRRIKPLQPYCPTPD